MAKLTLNNLTSGFASTATLNANFDAIEAALENTISRDGTTPNFMQADLDMNSYRILNCADILTSGNLIARGDWTATTDYSRGDLVNVGEQTYIAVDEHTSSSLFGDDSTHWQELFISYISQTGGGSGSSTPALPAPGTDDGSGWVLYTNGTTSSWVQISTLPDTSDPTFSVYSFTAAGGETTTSLPFTYIVGGKNLIVMINGLVQYPSDNYTEDTTSQITFLDALNVGDKVRIIGNVRSTEYVPTQAALAAIYALTPAANKFVYFTSSSAAALGDISSFMRSIMNYSSADAFLTGIGAAKSSDVSGLGVGQTWQDVTASRAVDTSYRNTTGKPIETIITIADDAVVYASVNNSTWVALNSASSDRGPVSFTLPNNHYAKCTGFSHWAELK